MGNYYAGMINNTGGYGELRHHGILGQKWGVRRFQNADGSLTAAGRERYYGKDGQKEIAKVLRDDKVWYGGTGELRKLPQIQDAAKRLSEEYEKVFIDKAASNDSFSQIYNKLYNSPKLHEKWLNKAVDNFVERNQPNVSRDEVYKLFKLNEDEIDEGGVFDTFIKESNDSDVEHYRKMEKNIWSLMANSLRKLMAFRLNCIQMQLQIFGIKQ